MKLLAQNIRRIRIERGLSQKELAALANWDNSNLSKLESDRYTWTKENLKPLAEALNVSLRDLFREPSNMVEAPLAGKRVKILDYIQAGQPTEVVQRFSDDDIESYLAVDLPDVSNLFAMIVRGDSMLTEFRPGDAVVLDRQLAPQPGDYVVAATGDGEATFKKYRPLKTDEHGRQIFALVPLNEDYPTLRSDEEELIIRGTLIEHRRFRRR